MNTSNTYDATGYLLVKNLFSPDELEPIHSILQTFHSSWLKDNKCFYDTKAVNSAYITRPTYLSAEERTTLFQFITDDKILMSLEDILPEGPAFWGTQLFFDPGNPKLKNYWHRDMQYNNASIEKQKAELLERIPLHLRIALRDEPGVELIPGTHKRWDTPLEYAVRMEENGHTNHDALPDSAAIPLKAGDMLIFSANIIHRGLYGMDRFAFDLMFTDQNPETLKYADASVLPDEQMLTDIKNRAPFDRTRQALLAK